jgi:hypothetical protein
MLNGKTRCTLRYRPEGLSAEPLPGLPSPRLTFTGRFRAGQAPETLVAAHALLAAPPAYLAGSRPPTMARPLGTACPTQGHMKRGSARQTSARYGYRARSMRSPGESTRGTLLPEPAGSST